MSEAILISAVAFFAAILTFFSGFGLGTMLTPVFMLFFPVDLAVALTGVVHFFNNIFKVVLVGRNVNVQVALRFGIPAVLFAFIGAWLLLQIAHLPPLFSYDLGGKQMNVFPVKLILAVLLILFALADLLPGIRKLQFDKSKLPLGGALSGFFGGLSGNQGALRSAFLTKSGLSKEAFIATAVVVSTVVDFTRLSVYAGRFSESGLQENIGLVAAATLAGITGSFVGNRLLKKVTMKFIQKLVAVLLIIFSFCLAAGII